MIDIEHEYRESAPNYSDAKRQNNKKRKRRGVGKIKQYPRYERGEKTGILRTFNRVRDSVLWTSAQIAVLDHSRLNRDPLPHEKTDPAENKRPTTMTHPIQEPDFSSIGKIAAWFLSE